jgi:hypothetical protein
VELQFDGWLSQVRQALVSINMPMERWQKAWPFDFDREFQAGTDAKDAAIKANKFWWQQQNLALGQDCRKMPDCWLPQGHEGKCEPS